jgi:hypothetical protein
VRSPLKQKEHYLVEEQFYFASFLQAGFESSTHKRRDGKRLDLVHSTGHDRFAAKDYLRVQDFGIRSVRESARWHLIEGQRGRFDFASLAGMLDAAASTNTEVILDLLHFGWPEFYDPFTDTFAERFAEFVNATAIFLRHRGAPIRYVAAVNEISYLAWAGGEEGSIEPCAKNRGPELKRSLVRSAALASRVLLDELPAVRLVAPEPVIHVVANPLFEGDEVAAAAFRRAQFEAWDMLSGRTVPELGGRPEYLDILGVNFYEHNQWVREGERLSRQENRYRPFREMLSEVWERYRRPLFVSETGTEDERRADWFDYICNEVAASMASGVPVKGICLYPILNHPGWEDDRRCCNGLLDYPDESGNREVHVPLAEAISRQKHRFAGSNSIPNESFELRRNLLVPSSMGLRIPETAASDEEICERT